ncbi:spore coat assembly protein SafA [Caldanaerovirga acetigignens]|uniref:Spore coat assembly protein SafA n=1 Tax=Caldanaerovirga acetigignens TaxID=447595 RepID=A0A1M7GVA8_9FIRM|nr:SPOCS domain-containing protein [Caldanaerovirga acetigignens]SHM20048.1 spore coat assembly protein SafA [Caldanaerovirga acetigignens]
MGVRLDKQLVKVDQVVGEDKVQAIVEGSIMLPYGKPDIEKVLSVEAKVNTENLDVNVIDDKVVIEGYVDVEALYVGKVPAESQPVHFVEGNVDFSVFAKIPGARKNMDVKVKGRVEHVQFFQNNTRPREIEVRIIVEFFVKVTKRVQLEIVVGATGPADLQVLKESIRIDHVVGEGRAQKVVKSEVDVPPKKPDILEILKAEGKVRTTETKALDNKVVIEGVLEIDILYVGDVREGLPQQPVHFMEAEIPFTEFVEVPDCRHDMSKTVKVSVEHIRARKKDERSITVEAVLDIKAKVLEPKTIEVVEDLFSPSQRLDVKKTKVKVDKVIGEGENQIVVKETFKVPVEKPPIEQIFKTEARVKVTETQIIEDKVVVEGVLKLETLYVAEAPYCSPQQPVHFVENETPFTIFVEIPGAREDMALDYEVEVEHVSSKVDPNDSRRYEVRVVLKLVAKVTRMVQMDVVVDVEEAAEEEKKGEKKEYKDDKPYMTIYIVQKGDTLWKIAKRYNVTLDAIIKANNIANPDLIYPGQKLIIPRQMH